MSRISGLRNGINKRTFYKERKINNRCFDFLSQQGIIVPLIQDINVKFVTYKFTLEASEIRIRGRPS